MRSDDATIFTCFLQYEPETVKVHDLVHRKQGGQWKLYKSFYRKLRLAHSWVEAELKRAGFSGVESGVDGGLITIVAR